MGKSPAKLLKVIVQANAWRWTPLMMLSERTTVTVPIAGK
jgi:hypothetical protein